MSLLKKNKKAKSEKHSRVNVMMAIIFVLSLSVIWKLFDLQVANSEHYSVLAMRQQQVKSKLLPNRGRIFIEDNKNGLENGEFFPLATNKQFALVFAKPNLISNPQAVAEGLFSVFNQGRVEAEVAQAMAEDGQAEALGDDFKKVKTELELKARKEKIINEYLAVLSKPDDPYEPIAKKVDEDTLEKVKELKLEGIDYAMENDRYYPEKNIGAHILGFVGFVGDKKQGRYGLEGFFDRELSGKGGSVMADRSANGDLIILDDKEYTKPEDGSDLFLTINRSIQFEACKKLSESVMKHGADGGGVIVMDPKTGAILAMCAYPDYDPNNYRDTPNINVYNNPLIFSQFEPGSTFKSITMAAALDQGLVTPDSIYQDKGEVMVEGWPKPIRNSDFATSGGHGITTMNTVLEKSLNTGVIYLVQKMGVPSFVQYTKNFGFGEKTGIELETEGAGNISNLTGKKVRPINAATASFGQGITTTALQMVNSYAAIANGGILMKPYIVNAVVTPAGEKSVTQPKQISRVISERTATLLTGMMVNAVENGHAKFAQVPGYYVAGKTGTAQVASNTSKGYENGKTIQTFIGFSPANDPKFVMLTRLDDPKDSKFAESSAVPLFGKIAQFILDYYQVPQERSLDEKKK